jgi:outer membrane protein assembly factor BamD
MNLKTTSRPIRLALSLLFAVTLAVLLSGCSLYKTFFGQGEEKDASELMSDGIENLERGTYTAAVESFQKLKDRYPYSKFAVTAELKMADALYLTEEYDQAYTAYDDFEKLHPKHKEIPYVIYQKGMSQFQQMQSKDREQGHTLKAKAEFEKVINRFTRSEYADRARKNLRQCLIYLAEYEVYVGHFYFQRGFYRAALARYAYAIENYPDLGHYHEALESIAKCKQKLAAANGQQQAQQRSWFSAIWR